MNQTVRNGAVVCLVVAAVALVAGGCLVGEPTVDAGGEAVDADRGSVEVGSDAGSAETGDRAPVVTVDAPLQVQIGETIRFDASASTDPEGAELSFEWQLLSKPQESGASLERTTAPTAQLRADVVGTYEVEVVVSDGTATARKNVTVSAINRAPTAEAEASSEVSVGNTVQLDGTGSSDPDGDALRYDWSLVGQPAGSSISIERADRATARFTPDVAGPYAVTLSVSDGSRSETDRVRVTATSDEPGATVYVRSSGKDANPGTPSRPVKTLAEAVAIAGDRSKVDAIDLGPSTFDATPTLTIAKTLTLSGAGKEATTLEATGARGLRLEQGAAVRLFGVTLDGGDPAIRVDEGARLDATNVRCEGASACVDAGTAFSFSGGAVTLTDSTLIGSGDGAGVQANNAPLTVRNVTVRDFANCISNGGAEMRLSQSTVEGCDKGLIRYAGGSVPVRVVATTFTGNAQGVVAGGAADIRIAESTFADHDKYGLRLQSGSAVVVAQTTIEQGKRSGIRAEGTSTLQLDGGAIRDNGRGSPSDAVDRAGLLLEDEARLLGGAGGTEIADHPAHGVVVRGEAAGTLEELDVHDAGDAAVWAKTTGNIVVKDGRYTESRYGFRCRGSTTLEIDGATVGENDRSGIRFQSTRTLKVRAATLTRNARYQVRVDRNASTLDLGTDADGGDNIFINESQWKFAIYDDRPRRSSATGTPLSAAGNVYRSGNVGLLFDQSSLDGTTVTGPATYANASAGDPKALYKIEHANQRISF